MPTRKKEVNLEALVDAVESGVTRKEIMKRFRFSTPGQVTAYYVDGLVEAGRAKPVVGRQPKAAVGVEIVKVSKRGSISVPKEMIDEMGFKEGDSFTIRKTKAGLALKVQ